MKRSIAIPVFAVIIGFFQGLNSVFAPSPPSVYDLQRRIDTILSKSSLRKVLFSVQVVDAATGDAVYEKKPHLALIPASNMKIVTSAAALEYLGRDFSFVTRVELCGGKSNAGDHNARWA